MGGLADVELDKGEAERTSARAFEASRNSDPSLSEGSASMVDAAARFTEILRLADTKARSSGRSVPTYEEKRRILWEFWRFVEILDREPDSMESSVYAQHDVRAIVRPWLVRSRLWCRALLQPHGHPWDFRLIEWTHSLEGDPCMNPVQPAIANALDAVFASLPNVIAIWHCRAWCRDLMLSMIEQLERPIRVLDLACGSSRSIRDVSQLRPGFIRLAAVDEDPAALAFTRSCLPGDAIDRVGLTCSTIDGLHELVPIPTWPEAGFDLVVSAGVFEHLDDVRAESLLLHMSNLTRPGGTTAICNAGPANRSRTVDGWIGDARAASRSPLELQALFPLDHRANVRTSVSADRTLVCAQAVK